MVHSDVGQLALSINASSDADTDEIERLTHHLRRTLLELDVENVGLVRSSSSPQDTKSGGAITWGSLLVTLAASGGLLSSVIDTVQDWLSRGERGEISVTIGDTVLTATGLSDTDRQQIIETWMKHLSPSA